MISTTVVPLNAPPSDSSVDDAVLPSEPRAPPSSLPPLPPPPPPPPSTHLPLPALPNAASQITPQIYLCDAHTAVSPNVITSLRITHVVSVLGPVLRFPPGVRILHLPIEDLPWEDLLSHLQKATEWMEQALRINDARVLVHCWQGISRSASVVAAYFIRTQDMSANTAVTFVRSKRPIVRPNQGFLRQLKQYEAIVRADDESDYSTK